MRSLRVLLTVFVAVVSLVLPPVSQVEATPRISVLASVQPLVLEGEGNICTTTSINRQKHLWLTAAHCVAWVNEDGSIPVLSIMGDQILPVMIDVPNDLAIVMTATVSMPAVPLAKVAPRPCLGWDDKLCQVQVTGYPFGFPFQVTTLGTVAAVNARVGRWPQAFLVFNLTGAPGNSGSAILNRKGEIVSVLQIGWGKSWSPIVAGINFATLASYRGYFGR